MRTTTYRHKTLSSLFALLFFNIILLLTALPVSADCPPNMISYWKLDETSGTLFVDFASSNDGTCIGDCPTPVLNGRIAGAQLFNATSTAIDVTPGNAFDFYMNDSFTIEFWIKRDSTDFQGSEAVVGRDDSQTTSLHWWVGLDDTGHAVFTLQANNGDSQTVKGTSSVIDNNWHHIAAVRNATTDQMIIYVDGNQENSQSVVFEDDFSSATAALNIGWLDYQSYMFFGGIIDELAIYSESLTDAQISQHYYDGNIGLRWGYCGCDQPVKIMPLGDSITLGFINNEELNDFRAGYRQKLYNDLIGLGYNIDFVGSRQSGQLAIPAFDIDHEGHGGWSPYDLESEVYGWLTNNPADVVLLHAGTNGLTTNPAGVELLLDEIDRYNEDIVVLLAKIINQNPYNIIVPIFNRNLETMALSRIANGDKIMIVDQESTLAYPYDLFDELHPNMTGYNKMAGKWAQSLLKFLPLCYQASPVILSTPNTMAYENSLYNYDLNASGIPTPVYAIESGPSGMTIDETTGLVSWTPDLEGDYYVSVSANNSQGNTYQNFLVKVAPFQIIDNGDEGTSWTGTWDLSSAPGYYGTQSVFNRQVGGGAYTYEATGVDGTAEIFLWWTEWWNRCTDVQVEIYDGETLLDDTIIIDQQRRGGQWNLVGTYDFTGTAKIVIISLDDTCSTNADAVKLVFKSRADLDRVIIEGPLVVPENDTANYSLRAYYTDGTNLLVASDYWNIDDNTHAEISSSGLLTTYAVDNDETIIISAGYTEDEITKQAAFQAIIDNHPTLTGIQIEGPTSVIENSSADYNLRAYYDDGSDKLVDPDSWGVDCSSYAGIDATGLLTTLEVTEDQACTVSASYTEGDVTLNTTQGITITDYVQPAEIIIDNGDDGTSWTNTWNTSGGLDYYGTLSVFNREVGGGTYTYEVTGVNSTTEVYLWWTEFSNRCTNIQVLIYDGDTLLDDTIRVNQQTLGGQWNLVGTYDFTGTAKVVIVSDSDVCSTDADAVKFTKATPLTLTGIQIEGPTSVIENSSADYNLRAYYDDGSDKLVDPDSWGVDYSSYAGIDATGLLTTLEVTEDQPCTVSASYTEGDVTLNTTQGITITDYVQPAEIIIDNGDDGTSWTNTWNTSGGLDYYGTLSVFNREVGGGTYTYEVTGVNSTTEVYLWWTEWSNRCTNIQVLIYDGDTLLDDTIRVNQQTLGGQWNLVGTYDFTGTAKVVIVSDSDVCSTDADAVKFTKATPLTLTGIQIEGPTSVIENSSADYNLRAYYDDGSDKLVDPDSWGVDCSSYAGIDATGLLTTFEVTEDQACTVSASYTEGDVTLNTTQGITITDYVQPAEIIIDNGDDGTSWTNTWNTSAGWTITAPCLFSTGKSVGAPTPMKSRVSTAPPKSTCGGPNGLTVAPISRY